jgi:ketosteroid isomerase-like protein
MKLRRAAVLMLAVSGISGAIVADAQTRSAQQDEVIEFVKRFDEAWNRKDVESVERALAAEYVYFNSKGRTSSRQRTLEFLRSPQYVLSSAERSELEVHHTGDTAVVSSRWKGHGTYNGEAFHDDQRCSVIVARAGRSWQVLSEHCTQIVSP